MNTIHQQYETAQELLSEFCDPSDKKFQHRYSALYADMQAYIVASGFQEKVRIDELILGSALVDYFEDIRRLKGFHHIPHINSIKLVAYMAYWLLRRKPLQMITLGKNLLYVNERFVLAYILEFLSDAQKTNILDRENSGLSAFSESLFYFLKYRHLDAQGLEMIIMAFFAGQIYQSEDFDLSEKLPSSDYAKDIEVDTPDSNS